MSSSIGSINQSEPSTKSDVILVQENRPSPKRLFLIISLALAFIAIVAGAFYYLTLKKFAFVDPLDTSTDQVTVPAGSQTDSNMFENPLNGLKFTNEEATQFKDRKPIAVMVNNYVVARPSAGLSSADVIYEAVAEAGITRLMPIFYSKIPEKVSSVRSIRYYFAELAAPYRPHMIHWGAAHVPPCQKAKTCPVETNPEVDAYDRIVKLGLPNLDGGNYSCDEATCAFGRDPEKLNKVPLEHTAFVRLPLIYELAKKIRVQDIWHKFVIPEPGWKFKDEAKEEDRGTIGVNTPITYQYWDTMAGFNVKWIYNKTDNSYTRYQGDLKQTDAINGQDLKAKVVIIRFTKQSLVGDKKAHLYHDIVGTGQALVFQDGKAIKGKWSRSTHDAMDVYTDDAQNQIEFSRGQIWVQLVPDTNKVTYENSPTGVGPAPIAPSAL